MTRRLFDVGDGVAISAVVRGTMPPDYLLVHGLASNALLWDEVGTQLDRQGRASLAVDQRGHGLSSKPTWGYDHAQIVQDLHRVCTTAESGSEDHRFIVVGQSWGAAVAADFAAAHPELVGGVVLVDGGLVDLKDHFETWEECRDRLTPPDLRLFPYKDLSLRIRDMHPDWSETALRAALGNLLELADGGSRARLGREEHMLILRALYDYSPAKTLPKIGVPVLALAAVSGGGDTGKMKLQALEAASRDHGVRLEVFVDGDHDLHAQQPDKVVELLLDFEQSIREVA